MYKNCFVTNAVDEGKFIHMQLLKLSEFIYLTIG